MSKLINTNPDFFITDVPADTVPSSVKKFDYRRIIYCTTDEPLILAPAGSNYEKFIEVPTDRHLTVYAVNLIIAGDIEVPGGDIQICCKNLEVLKAKKHTSISTTIPSAKKDEEGQPIPDEPKEADPQTQVNGTAGKNGDDKILELQAKGEKYGKKGANGGRIRLVCNEIKLNGDLKLIANGSVGYSGINGQTGATGLKGSDEVVGTRRERTVIDTGPTGMPIYGYKTIKYSKSPAKKGGNGGNGGKGGMAGSGGDGGIIEVRYGAITADSKGKLITSVAPGIPGKSGKPGSLGKSGSGGSNQLHNHNKMPEGKPGVKGEEADTIPCGIQGSYLLQKDTPMHRQGNFFDDIFSRKVLQKIKYLYLFNSPQHFTGDKVAFPMGKEVWERTGNLLNWLTNSLEDYYDQKQLKNEIDLRKNSILSEAANININYQAGYTYFGHSPAYVPRVRIKTILQHFKDSFPLSKAFQDSFLKLQEKYETGEKKRKLREKQISDLTLAVAIYSEKKEFFRDQVTEYLTKVEGAMDDVNDKMEKLNTAIADFIGDIEGYFQCDMKNIIKGAEMLAFTGVSSGAGIAMGATQLFNIISDGVENIEDAEGKKKSKKYVINSIIALDGELETAVRPHLKDGKIEDNRQMLFTDIAKLESTINKFTEKFPKNHIPEIMESFKQALIHRSEMIIAFNLSICYYDEYIKKAKKVQKELDKVKNQEQPLNPYDIATTSHYALLYQDMIEKNLEKLYQLNRKFAYVTLGYCFERDDHMSLNRLWVDGEAPAKETVETIIKKVDDVSDDLELDYFANQTSGWRAFPNKQSDIVKIHLTANHPLMAAFKKNKSISFKIVRKPGKLDNEIYIEALKEFCNVRITHIVPMVVGAKTSNKEDVQIKIKNSGESLFYDENEKEYKFSHLPVHTTVEHPVGLSADTNINMDEDDNGKLTDEYLDTLGIYGSWELYMPHYETSLNKDLDLDNVSDIIIHFKGHFRTNSNK